MTARPPFRTAAILWAGLICGTLDIADALIFYGLRGVPPDRLLQNIASGLLGPTAFQGGSKTVLLGLLLHFVIAFCAVMLFYLFWRAFAAIRRHYVVCGLIYGLGVYFFMNYAVLPLVFSTRRLPVGIALVNAIGALMLFIGLTAALVFRWQEAKSKAAISRA